MDECHQSYPWRTETKNPLVYLVSVNNWLVEWSAKDGYMGRQAVSTPFRVVRAILLEDSWQTSLQKVPGLEDEGATSLEPLFLCILCSHYSL